MGNNGQPCELLKRTLRSCLCETAIQDCFQKVVVLKSSVSDVLIQCTFQKKSNRL